MAANKYLIEVTLPLPDGRMTPQDCNNAELAAAMNQELDDFNQHMRTLPGQDQLVPAERALLKTYLAWKILRAKNGNHP